MVALVLACLTLITLDHRGGADSPLEPARRAVGDGLRPGRVRHRGRRPPVHRGAATGSAPATACSDDIARLEAAELPAARRSSPPPATTATGSPSSTASPPPPSTLGYALVPARVVADRARPSRSRARSPSTPAPTPACAPTMTVLNDDGLVGRVLRVDPHDRHRAADRRHRVGRRRPGRREHGGRLPARPRAASATHGRLDLELVDQHRGARQGRHRRHLGQPRRRAVRRRASRSAGSPRSTPACASPPSAR